MELQAGKSYYSGQDRKHAIDVLQIVEEPGRGTVALASYYHIAEPHNRQFELFNIDGLYRSDRKPDPAWDVSGEYTPPARGELQTGMGGGLFDSKGRKIFPFVSARAIARIYSKNETIPIVKFSYEETDVEGYVKLEVYPDSIVNELINSK